MNECHDGKIGDKCMLFDAFCDNKNEDRQIKNDESQCIEDNFAYDIHLVNIFWVETKKQYIDKSLAEFGGSVIRHITWEPPFCYFQV